ncbi:NAD(P)/FAD-dependent oxidoreductase [Pseudomonas sp. M30-35]|uniref:dihydrolipoyl dehydrogenase family protein n=1 Tax=Pseudomonas sp. M30-35 TaxID=1981174 RepID=UPI000B3C9A76|nr:NAD(P)/FAD-dependent oxidoreductase [Pseudomonas sp. M30-35]ARU89640.1 pyruvate dehydrogenase [Pseudomonas sp. M30-35]
MSEKFDAIIIGGGNAGFGVSAVLAKANKTIAFIEQAEFGGTCPNRGCTPKKVLVAAAKSLDEISKAAGHGISIGKPTIDWAALITRKNKMIDHIPSAMKGVAEKRGTVFAGQGKFVGTNQVEVNGQVLEAEHIIIATGSKTRPLPIPGAELMITSDEVLSNSQPPKEVVFIGGGVIALEFSHVYARAGAKVTIIEVMPQLLPRIDADAVAALQAATEALGIIVKTSVNVEKITQSADSLAVHIQHQGKALVLNADTVINGAGRVANIEGLNLEAAGISHDGARIEVNANFQSTSNKHVWVAGDALATTPQLSPVATYEGQIVGNNILNSHKQTSDYRVLPTSVYTIPALSSVGLTEKEARDSKASIEVVCNDMTDWFSSQNVLAKHAWAKIIIDKNTDLILGAHILGHQGEELINLIALAMRFNITRAQLKDQFYAYPTFSSDIKNLL